MFQVGRAEHPETGRTVEWYANTPGVQFYTGNFLDGDQASSPASKGKNGAKYTKHNGFCLETQHFPDSVNQPAFSSVMLSPGEVYKHSMVHRFETV
eukprot:SAG31_NODE_7939_length_1560_cov_0.775496_1_plen_96_part_00